MKLKISKVLLAVAVVVVALYVYKQWTTPTVNVDVKKEGFSEDGKTVFAAIFGGGALLFFVGFMIYAMFNK